VGPGPAFGWPDDKLRDDVTQAGRRFRGAKRREHLRIVIQASLFDASFFAKRTRILICLQFSTSFGEEIT
jgi:hypothetical protein